MPIFSSNPTDIVALDKKAARLDYLDPQRLCSLFPLGGRILQIKSAEPTAWSDVITPTEAMRPKQTIIYPTHTAIHADGRPIPGDYTMVSDRYHL
jgi:hypothetical protein